MAQLKKAKVTLGNVPLAATQGVAWRLVTGVQPFMAVYSVHKGLWSRLKEQKGQPLQLKITDSRGVTQTVNQVYILHEAPSDSPHRVSFVVADKRWKWGCKLVARDYNVPRKTGDRRFDQRTVPVETQVPVDTYDYLAYSLKPPQNTVWRARDVVEDVLKIVEGDDSGGFQIDSFPIADTSGGNNTGEFSIQNVMLRDQGDAALARVLSYVPGAEVYIRPDGRTVIFDGTDLDAAEQYFAALPVSTYAGEAAAWIDRSAIRPSSVIVHYQREVEMRISYSDDYGGTSANPVHYAPYCENVLPTVDATTTIYEFDPVTRTTVGKQVPPGTWVRVDKWLDAMNQTRPPESLPWTFRTISIHWLKGDLEAVLGASGLDFDPNANIAARVQALRQHFRQTFRINRKYMERIRSLRAVRVALLDPVTGARAPAAVWGQACHVPSAKWRMTKRGTTDLSKLKVYRNVDYLNPSRSGGANLLTTPVSPAAIDIVDEECGVFRIDWRTSMAGLDDAILPCLLVGENNQPTTPTRDLSQQDTQPMGAGILAESGTNGIFLSDTMDFEAVLTVVPCAPNGRNQFHQIEVEADDVASIFRSEYRITKGKGPKMEVFVPPGEITARLMLVDPDEAYNSIGRLLGITPGSEEGIGQDEDIPGYELVNERRADGSPSGLAPHAQALAAEVWSPFADSIQGAVATRVPDEGLKLAGNMGSATIRVGTAPSAKVDAIHEFPGQQRQISRLALMPNATRQQVLGIVAFPS